MIQMLMTYQLQAKHKRSPVPIDDLLWQDDSSQILPSMRPSGHQWSDFSWFTDSWEIGLGRTPGSLHGWTATAQIRSKFLWRVGYERATDLVGQTLARILQTTPEDVTLSRIDQCADLAGYDLRHEDKDRFSTPATKRRDHPDKTPRPDDKWQELDYYERSVDQWGQLATLYLGSGASPMQARLYRKDWQMQNRPQASWYGEIARLNGWTGERDDPLLRLEWQYRREHLKRMGIQTPADAWPALGDLWRDATTWLTYRQAGGAALVRQRKVVPWWEEIRTIWDHRRLGLVRAKTEWKPQIDHLLDQGAGIMSSVAAVLDLNPDDTPEKFKQLLQTRLNAREIDLEDAIRDKLVKLGKTPAKETTAPRTDAAD